MTERYGAENERSAWMRFHTQTAGVSLTPQQPLNNLTRVALQALAAVLGGTQSLHTDAYDEALAVPTAEAAMLALRQQQIIAEESGVDATVDPLGGSWFVEALTDETERQVWRYLDEIDRRGGMVAAITEGYPQHEIADAAYRYQREFDAGERRVVGINAYVDATEPTRDPGPGRAGRLGGAPPRAARADPARARPGRGRGGPARPARDGRAPGVERDEPDAPFHPLRRRVRDARRAVRGPARGLRGVPRAGRGLTVYLDALEFLDEERDAWRPFEALAGPDRRAARASRSMRAHGWSGRQLMAHLLAWQEVALAGRHGAGRQRDEPRQGPRGRGLGHARRRGRQRRDRRALGGAPDGRAARPVRLRPGQLRGYLTVVPESRWLKHADHQRFFLTETTGHYEEHGADLAAILAAAGR